MVLGPKKRVVVHLIPSKGGQSVEGYLTGRRSEFVLDLAELQMPAGENPVAFDGRLRIPRENVAFYQVLR